MAVLATLHGNQSAQNSSKTLGFPHFAADFIYVRNPDLGVFSMISGEHIVGLIIAVAIAVVVLGPREFRELGPSLSKGLQETWAGFIAARERNLSHEIHREDFWPPAA